MANIKCHETHRSGDWQSKPLAVAMRPGSLLEEKRHTRGITLSLGVPGSGDGRFCVVFCHKKGKNKHKKIEKKQAIDYALCI